MQVLLSQPSRPASEDMQAQASSGSRGPSGNMAHSSCSHSSHVGAAQRKPSDDAGGGRLSRQASEESTHEQHAHAAGSLLLHDGHPRQDAATLLSCETQGSRRCGERAGVRSAALARRRWWCGHCRAVNGGLGSSTARHWGPAASGMRRVPENRAAEAYEVLMSRAGGSQAGSINSEDAAAVSAYVRDSLAWSSDRAQHGAESQASGDSRMSSMGPHDGSAVVRPGDAHAALRRALSLVKKQGSMVVPEEVQEAPEQQLQPSPGNWQARHRGQQVLPKQGSEQPSDAGMTNGHGGYQSDAAMSAFIRKAFNKPTS